METAPLHVWMFPNSNDNSLLGGVLVMKKFDWENFLNHFGDTYLFIVVSMAIGILIYSAVVSSFMRLLVGLALGIIIISGIIAYILTKHDKKS